MRSIKAAFFDRDGTLIRYVPYLSSINHIQFIPKTIDLCRELQNAGYALFLVTNQSGIARGYFSEEFVQKTHKYIDNYLQHRGIYFKQFYYCPHHPKEGIDDKYKQQCICRKPKPGMLFQAAKEYDIDLSCSLMFGDEKKDIEAGKAAGCKVFFIQDVFARDTLEINGLVCMGGKNNMMHGTYQDKGA